MQARRARSLLLPEAKQIKTPVGESAELANACSRMVDDAGVTMEEIVVSVQRAASIMGEISVAGQEQSLGIEQVNEAVAHLDEMTQQNAAMVEQAAAAAGSMQSEAVKLRHLVNVFRIVASDGLATSPRTSAPHRLEGVIP